MSTTYNSTPNTAYSSAEPSTSAPLYSPMQIAMGTFLGGFAAGGFLLAGNYHRMARKGEAIAAAIGGVLATLAMIGLAMTMPQTPGMLLGVVQTFAMLGIAKMTQGKQFQEHVEAGGEIAKGWKPVLVSLGTGAVVFLLILVIALLSV